MIVQACKQRSPARTAAGSIVKLRKPDTVGSQVIEVWRMDFTSVTAYVRKTQGVSHNQNEVRPDVFRGLLLAENHAGYQPAEDKG